MNDGTSFYTSSCVMQPTHQLLGQTADKSKSSFLSHSLGCPYCHVKRSECLWAERRHELLNLIYLEHLGYLEKANSPVTRRLVTRRLVQQRAGNDWFFFLSQLSRLHNDPSMHVHKQNGAMSFWTSINTSFWYRKPTYLIPHVLCQLQVKRNLQNRG